MKKILFIAFAALMLVGCGNNEPTMSRIVLDLQVEPSQWEYSGQDNNNYFIARFNMPEFTSNVYHNGQVQVYREYDHGTDKATQMVLPYIRHNEYPYTVEGDDENTYWGFYTETVDYEYGYQFLNIFYTASDFDYELNESFVPEAMHFRVVVLY